MHNTLEADQLNPIALHGLPPGAFPDFTVGNNRVRIPHIHPDLIGTEFGCIQTAKMQLGRLAEPYAALLGPETRAFLLTILMMSPPIACLRMISTPACVLRIAPLTSTS